MKRFFLLLILAIALGFTATASPVYGTSATMSGSTGLTGFGNWAGNFQLTWNILQNGSLYDYSYTLSETGSNLSHIVIEFSSSCGQDLLCITNATNDATAPQTWDANSPPNFEMPAAIYGVKFDQFTGSGPYTFSFTSDRAPVWGDYYARDGGNAYAYNPGIIDHQSSLTSNFIARPDGGGGDTQGSVPEPGSLTMIAGGLIAIAIGKIKLKNT